MSIPTKSSPVSVRIEGEDRALLDRLAAEHGSNSSALLEGLRALGQRHAEALPLYPRLVEEPAIAELIDEAADAAVQVLDQLFAGEPPETRGVSSNFRGGLREHLEAMLRGLPAAPRTTQLHLKPLLGNTLCLGRVRSALADEGYTVMRLPVRIKETPAYFHSRERGFVALEQLDAGDLFTSSEAALKEAFAWMQSEEFSPRDMPLRLCILGWGDTGPLTLRD